MNKADLVAAVALKTNLSRKQADTAVSAILDEITAAVADGEKVSLVGFGTFEKRDRDARQARNPKTGETIELPARSVPGFTAGKGFKEALYSSAQ